MLGRMNADITICATIQTKDSKGFVTNTDNALAAVKAYKEERHGSTAWKNRAAFTTSNTLFRFRIIPNVTLDTAMVILCGGERYNVTSAQVLGGMYVEVLADKTKPSGG